MTIPGIIAAIHGNPALDVIPGNPFI